MSPCGMTTAGLARISWIENITCSTLDCFRVPVRILPHLDMIIRSILLTRRDRMQSSCFDPTYFMSLLTWTLYASCHGELSDHMQQRMRSERAQEDNSDYIIIEGKPKLIACLTRPMCSVHKAGIRQSNVLLCTVQPVSYNITTRETP